jgi:hypothetical protein
MLKGKTLMTKPTIPLSVPAREVIDLDKEEEQSDREGAAFPPGRGGDVGCQDEGD